MASHPSIPFESSVEAWFWTIGALRARAEGARATGGPSTRPCEPDDVVRCLNSLYRSRDITLEHAEVLKRWGDRQMSPAIGRYGHKDHVLWREAMERLTPALQKKGIVEDRCKGKKSLTCLPMRR